MGYRQLQTITMGVVCLFLLTSNATAQTPPSEATAGSELQELERKEQLKREKLLPRLPAIEGTPALESPEPTPFPDKEFMVAKIQLDGASLDKELRLSQIVSKYENRSLSLNDLNKIVQELTSAYTNAGYITSFAYIPLQEIVDGNVQINIIEGTVGNISIEGAHHFSEKATLKNLEKHKGSILNYNHLLKELILLNGNPDREVKFFLQKGKENGTTDIVLKQTDRLPLHTEYAFNNTGTKFTGRRRNVFNVRHNNLIGRADTLKFEYSLSTTGDYETFSASYLTPLKNSDTFWELSFRKLNTKISGSEFEVLGIKSDSKIFSSALTKMLSANTRFITSIDARISRKEIVTNILGTPFNKDELTVIETGSSIREYDSHGRTYIRNQLSFGIPEFLGSSSRVNERTSRVGAGPKFFKYSVIVQRQNRLPKDSTLNLSVSAQITKDRLVSAEQLRIGGLHTVRGYPEGEALGDYGVNIRSEILTPLKIIPESLRMQEKPLDEIIKGVFFVDYASAHLIDPSSTQSKSKDLTGTGFGIRFNEKPVSGRFEVAWPVGQASSGGGGPRFHMDFGLDF